MQLDVLIVGAGPTGLMLANQLARWGLRPVIIDRHSGPAQQSRAMAVQARTLEIYAKMGLVEKALSLGAIGTAANLWADGRHTARIPIGDIGQGMSPYPFVLMLSQDENEQILGERLRSFGIDVLWNTELIALIQHSTHVEVTIKQPDGSTQRMSAMWVAGCDGARSSVREINGIKFPGAPYEHVFFVADTTATGTMKDQELNVYLWRDGFHLFFPMRGKDHWRVIGILPAHLRSNNVVTFDEVVPELQKEGGSTLSFKACDWFSTYRIHHRAAERFRDRRCFLLGDAAHVHSPMGAQGMNTGLQDAYNLAWKLALVAQRRAAPALLDSYEQERIPVAERLLQTTDRAFQLIVSDNRFAGLFRTRIIARIASRAMTIDRLRRLAFRTISQIGIRYPGSTLSKTLSAMPRSAPTAGDRFPWLQLQGQRSASSENLFQTLEDVQFNLLIFGLPVPKAEDLNLGYLLKMHAIDADEAQLARHKIPYPSFYLLRPDGHVGLCGTKLDVAAIKKYMIERIHLTALQT